MKGDTSITGSPEDIRQRVVSLTFCCPFDGDNPSYCPLQDVRILPYAERLDWCTRLNEDDLFYLDAYHRVCLQTKTDPEMTAPCADSNQ